MSNSCAKSNAFGISTVVLSAPTCLIVARFKCLEPQQTGGPCDDDIQCTLTEKALTVARKAKQAMTRRAVRNIVGGAQGNCSTGVVTKAKRNQTAELEESRTNSITTTGDF
jgi:hypothetical protein